MGSSQAGAGAGARAASLTLKRSRSRSRFGGRLAARLTSVDFGFKVKVKIRAGRWIAFKVTAAARRPVLKVTSLFKVRTLFKVRALFKVRGLEPVSRSLLHLGGPLCSRKRTIPPCRHIHT
jgi:hypothetical protein